MSFIIQPAQPITNPQYSPVTITADSTSPLYASLTYTWTITDLDSYVTYTVSTTNGSVSVTNGTISYIPGSAGAGGFTINDRNIPLTINANPSPSYLLIGGGGAGGRGSPAGGGGAGGYLTGSTTVTPGTPLTITIGAGGSGGVGSYQAGNPGSTTVFGAFSVIGGGGSAGEKAQGQTGYASGGGGGAFVSMYQTGIAGTSGIGFGGGNGGAGGGGGGGALGAGQDGQASTAGYGGNGYVLSTIYPTVTSTTSNTIGTGTKTFTVASGLHLAANQNLRISNGSNYMYGLVTSYSGTTLVFECYFVDGSGTFTSWTINNMYAGGGGGGGISVYGYAGGRGGTGNVTGYGTTGNGSSGADNSGGGGGGGSYANNSGGNGGSGVVVIRSAGAAQATTGSPSVITEGAFYIYTFTASGTITF